MPDQPQPAKSSTADLSLDTLHQMHAAEWAVFCAIPQEDVRAYWDNGQPPGPVADSFARMGALAERIEKHPDAQDFEADLRAALGPQMAADDTLAAEVWSSMANASWNHEKGTKFETGFRHAGAVIAEIRNAERAVDDEDARAEDYMHWYCSGPYAVCSDRVAEALAPSGWTWADDVA